MDFISKLKKKEGPTEVMIDCLPDVKIHINMLSPKEHDEATRKATKRNKFNMSKFRMLLVQKAVVGWEGLTVEKAMAIMPGMELREELEPKAEVLFDNETLKGLTERSHDFSRDIATLVSDSLALAEAKEEAKEDEEAEVKNSSGSAAPGSAEKRSPAAS